MFKTCNRILIEFMSKLQLYFSIFRELWQPQFRSLVLNFETLFEILVKMGINLLLSRNKVKQKMNISLYIFGSPSTWILVMLTVMFHTVTELVINIAITH